VDARYCIKKKLHIPFARNLNSPDSHIPFFNGPGIYWIFGEDNELKTSLFESFDTGEFAHVYVFSASENHPNINSSWNWNDTRKRNAESISQGLLKLAENLRAGLVKNSLIYLDNFARFAGVGKSKEMALILDILALAPANDCSVLITSHVRLEKHSIYRNFLDTLSGDNVVVVKTRQDIYSALGITEGYSELLRSPEDFVLLSETSSCRLPKK
jgi:hypothetical protein